MLPVAPFWPDDRGILIVAHANPYRGINCALGAKEMAPYIRELSRIANTFVHCYPNAGLPNPLAETGYDERPVDTAAALHDLANQDC